MVVTAARIVVFSAPGHGAIAQVGERLPCKQEVGGSIPPGSTKPRRGSGRSGGGGHKHKSTNALICVYDFRFIPNGVNHGSFTIRVVKGARKREFVYVIHIGKFR